jgi:hypothetical protein
MDWIKHIDKSNSECFSVALKVPIFFSVFGVGVNNFRDVDLIIKFNHKEDLRYFSNKIECRDMVKLVLGEFDLTDRISVLYKQYVEVDGIYLCNIPSAIVIEMTIEELREIRINSVLDERT